MSTVGHPSPAEYAAKVVHVPTQRQFQLALRGDDRAYVEYELPKPVAGLPPVLDLTHTIVPSAYGGQGIAGVLVKHAFEYAKAEKMAVRPTCSYAAQWVAKNATYQTVLERQRAAL